MKSYIYKIMCVGAAACMMASCVDTIILPDDKTVDEDFWKTKEQVASMVNGAYAAMAGNDVLEKLIVWGDFRGDELLRNASAKTSTTTTALDEIAAVNMQTTNQFAAWAPLYAVINRCNIVLERAEAVMQEDPNYTLGDYQVDRSQMLALRALCYFYLVRNFRDVPLTTEAYMNSSQNMQLPQSAPTVILDQCIADLKEAAQTALAARGYTTTDWRRVGWITDDAINTILADIYLWRASVMHNADDYQQCVDYCDLVIDSKRAQHVRGRNEVVEKDYPLADAASMYSSVFVVQNAEESIFEIQSRSNTSVCYYYYKYESATGNGGSGWLKAAPIFGAEPHTNYTATTSVSDNALYSSKDMRYYATCYIPSTGEESYDVRKIVSQASITSKTTVKTRDTYNYGGLDCNYNVYRLTDVMLMKAEALVQQVDTTWSEEQRTPLLQQAFNLVQAVNARALHQENEADSMKWNTFRAYTKDQFERLVMQERLREFCFEGRRWYDLMRYDYRHMDGVDYSRTLAQQVDAGEALPTNYKDMLTLMTRSRGNEASGVQAKMENEAYLYMPIPNSELIVCPLLRQNPAYKDNNEYEKNY